MNIKINNKNKKTINLFKIFLGILLLMVIAPLILIILYPIIILFILLLIPIALICMIFRNKNGESVGIQINVDLANLSLFNPNLTKNTDENSKDNI